MRFYLKSVYPNQSAILDQRGKIPENIDSIMGLQFELLVVKNKGLIFDALDLTPEEVLDCAPYCQAASSTQPGCQIDLLIRTKRLFTIIEIKFKNTKIDSAIIRDIGAKIDAFPLPKGLSLRTALVHINGISDSVIKSKIFDHIIDVGDVIEQWSI